MAFYGSCCSVPVATVRLTTCTPTASALADASNATLEAEIFRMTTTNERVEITPELLAGIEAYAGDVWKLHGRTRAVEMRADTALALVERIRELESERAQADTEEARILRAWWAALSYDEQRSCLMRRNPESCPCGAGTKPGHPYAWCMPHPAWLPRNP